MTFQDHFSKQATAYSQYRPSYPPELFSYLADLAPGKKLAWDVATGNGQAARCLAPYFDRVWATDASSSQIAQATPNPKIHFAVEAAEASSLADESVDLVTVAQALHWFDQEKFFSEVQRVLRPGGIFAAWAYPLHQITPAIDEILFDFYENIVGPYWPPERRLVEQRYETINFPYPLLETPPFQFVLHWNIEELLGYLSTWSATQRYIRAKDQDPIPLVAAPLKKLWGPEEKRYRVSWDLILKVCQKP